MNSRLSLQLNLTNICVSNCITCMRKTWPQENMSDEVFASFLKSVEFSDRIESLFLTGGEPLLFPRLRELINFLKKEGISVGFLTAGNVDADWEFFVSNRNIKWIRFSIDASDSESYKKIRGTNTFEKVLDNLRKLKELSDYYGRNKNFLRINFTRSKFNVGQEFVLRDILDGKNIDVPIKTWGTIYRDDIKRKEDFEGVSLDFKYCVVPYRHAIIDTDGFVYPCCYLMYEIDDYNNKKRDKWCYGKITSDIDFFEIFDLHKAVDVKNYLYDNRQDICKFCYRYYIENAYYEKYLEDERWFL